MRARRRSRALFLISGALVLLAPLPAAAHLRLVRSEPAAGATLTTSPAIFRLVFSVPPVMALSGLTLVSSAGDTIPITPLVADTSDKRIVFAAPRAPLVGGSCTLIWRAASADAHPLTGRIAFTLASTDTTDEHAHHDMDAPAVTGESSPVVDLAHGESHHTAVSIRETDAVQPISIAATVVRAVSFGALFALVGAVCFRFLVLGRLWRWHNGKRESGALWHTRNIALGACAAYLVSHTARFAMDGAVLLGSEPVSLTRVIDIVANTMWGLSWVVGFAGVVIALVGMTGTGGRPALGWSGAAIGAVLLAISAGMSGHAAAAPGASFAMTLVAVHVLAAAAWLGTLLVMVFAGIPAALYDGRGDAPHASVAELVSAYSPVALVASGIAFVSGTWTALINLPSLSDALTTAYGRTLLLKLGVLGFAILLGFVNWLIVTPKLGGSAGTRHIRRTSKLELVVGALVLVVTAVLVVTPLPGD